MGKIRSINALSIMLVLIIFKGFRSAESFDYYYFVQQWPVSYCGGRCCYPQTRTPPSRGDCPYLQSGEAPSDFSIHGLWPQNKHKRPPTYCYSSRVFNFSKISDLKEELTKYWGSLKCQYNSCNFWKHEWEKHGTCSLNLDERSYFEKTLSLRREKNLLSALQAAGIRPNGRKYSLDSIQTAIKQSITKRPVVSCNNNNELFEVYVCVNKSDASTVIDCPTDHNKQRCPPMVVFPI